MTSHAGDDGGTPVAASLRRKVLVAVDQSDKSLYALSWAIDNLIAPHRSQSECDASSDLIVLLHVEESPLDLVGPIGPEFYVTPEIMDSLQNHQQDISKKVLLRAKTLCDEKHLDSETMVAVGDPRDAICRAVEKLNTHYLIMGSHGYGAFKRVLLGSVSDYCAHNAKCPVVIVKKP